MAPLLALALALQIQPVAQAKSTPATDTSKAKKEVSVGVRAGDGRRQPKRQEVTAEHLRTAYKSPAARELMTRARKARMSQDSALQSYDATTYLRISAFMGFSKIGRDRLMFRHENATQVKWKRDVGAWIEVKGARTVIPIAPEEASKEANADMDTDITPVPYYPGQEPLLSLNDNESVRAEVNERDIVHPFAEGSEAYYIYDVGDSVNFTLPGGVSIQLREINVRPRRAQWNLVVGSLWFDTRTGQLVRAAYRLSVPMDVWSKVAEEDSTVQDSIPFFVKPLISPMNIQVSAIAVEYGLYQGRFWLPRLKSFEGDGRMSFVRVPFRMEQNFKYASVNALDSLPKIEVAVRPEPPDSLTGKDLERWRDSVRNIRRAARRAEQDSIKQGLKIEEPRCDSTNSRTVMEHRRDSNMNIAVHVTCDMNKLVNSPDLPKSIYDTDEEVFGSAERDALIKEALSMGAQPPLAFGMLFNRPQIKWGLEFTRYNRVEGFSTGARLEQNIGAGYTASVQGRLGVVDFVPNLELGLSRSNLRRVITGRVYGRLNSVSDWGNPLSFGASLKAMFGRDEGFYYRTSGAEIEIARERGNMLTWRLFAERQRAATASRFSVAGIKAPNITTPTQDFAGASMRWVKTLGLDPNRLRAFTDLRLEGATRDTAGSAFGRAALDVTLTDVFGKFAGALTLAGGTSVGAVPKQRLWYLGGMQTVRGQVLDTARAGNAFWLSRAEIGSNFIGARPVVFTDFGWVGDRTKVKQVGRPMSGVGVGVSFMDGLIRADFARGIYPRRGNYFDMYFEGRF